MKSYGTILRRELLGKIDYSIIGKTFNFLTVLDFAGLNKHNKAMFKCKCKCGNEIVAVGYQVKTGKTKSCGCYHIEKITTHGASNSVEYQAWADLKDRCYNHNNKYYHDYGGRGIFVCRRWRKSFENFYKDMGERPSSDLSIERIDNNGPYAPWNCKWGTVKEQNRNKRTNRFIHYNAEALCISDFALKYNIDRSTLRKRINIGWDIDDILSEQIRPKVLYITYNGVTKTITEYAKEYSINRNTLYNRINAGWNVYRALHEPVNKK